MAMAKVLFHAYCLVALISSISSQRAPLSTPPPPLPHETDWFSLAGHGIFTHYLDKLQNDFGRNSQGKNTSWDECVSEFDVEAYASDAHALGARYATITIMQGTQYMIAPNSVYDNLTGYAPGAACSTRDLVLDLWEALDKRGMKLNLYWTGDGPHLDPQGAKGMGWVTPPPGGQVTLEFVQRWTSVLKEYAVRYGDKVSAWWIDGMYASIYGYNDTLIKYYHDAIRAGNPSALIAVNNGVKHPIDNPKTWANGGETSAWEDFTCGETDDFTDIPTSRWVVGPAGDGPANITVQWHSLGYLGSEWAAPGFCQCAGSQPDCSVKGCRPLRTEDLKLYTQEVNSVGGVLTIDLQLLRNGSLNAQQASVLASVWSGSRICAADFNSTMCCCGQEDKCGTTPVTPGKQCTAKAPTCKGFEYGTTYGTCVANQLSLEHM
eukprot:m.154521 g.154521  ORF g.154521 m.154521 type:complete len:434 (+) comp30893_c0_seq2:45-1346(+)